jgi:hypothetical protein
VKKTERLKIAISKSSPDKWEDLKNTKNRQL